MKYKILVSSLSIEKPKVRIICFPYAGGSAHIYSQWKAQVPAHCEILSVQLPGRTFRCNENCHLEMKHIVDELMECADYITDLPYVTFGHSFGGKIAYEFLTRVHRTGYPPAKMFFASGCPAPHLLVKKRNIHNLADADFIQIIASLNGTDKKIFENKEFVEFVLPALRADFKILDEYRASPITLNCSATILYGESDTETNQKNLKPWDELFKGNVNFSSVKGDHFFIHQSQRQVLGFICNELNKILSVT